MEPLETIKAKIEKLKPTLQNEYHITELGIFGSHESLPTLKPAIQAILEKLETPER